MITNYTYYTYVTILNRETKQNQNKKLYNYFHYENMCALISCF